MTGSATLLGAPPPTTEGELEEYLSRPSERVITALASVPGDILVLGAGGKMGPSLCAMARRARDLAGDRNSRIIAASRFAAAGALEVFRAMNVEPIATDLLQDGALEALPDAANVIYLPAFKFGSTADLPGMWAVNTFLAGQVARRFQSSRIVALSTGNVYPLSSVLAGGGATETSPVGPVGEYAQSCLGRERLFAHSSALQATPIVIARLNYANALRYGVLVDITDAIVGEQAVSLQMGFVNVIWQGDANAAILQSLALATAPPAVLNVSGPETVSVRWLSHRLAEELGKPAPIFEGTEQEHALLTNSAKFHGLLGYPTVPLDQLIRWTASWVSNSGALLKKPTRFEIKDGRF